MSDLALHAARSYTATRPITAPKPGGPPAIRLQDFAESFAQTLQTSERTATQAMHGNADPHALVQALSQTELAVEAAVTIRNKVVEAYQEILRMPV